MDRQINFEELALSVKDAIETRLALKKLAEPRPLGRSGETVEAFDFGKLKVAVYDNGDIEMTGPIYYAIVERYDYSTVEEAQSKVLDRIRYVDENFDRLVLSPELRPQPIVDRLIAFVKSKFVSRK